MVPPIPGLQAIVIVFLHDLHCTTMDVALCCEQVTNAHMTLVLHLESGQHAQARILQSVKLDAHTHHASLAWGKASMHRQSLNSWRMLHLTAHLGL